jgi:hypothetical protein
MVKAYVHSWEKEKIIKICEVLGISESELIKMAMFQTSDYIKLTENMNID